MGTDGNIGKMIERIDRESCSEGWSTQGHHVYKVEREEDRGLRDVWAGKAQRSRSTYMGDIRRGQEREERKVLGPET